MADAAGAAGTAGADLDLDPDRGLPGRLVFRRTYDDHNQHPDGKALDYAHADTDHTTANDHANAEGHADEFGVPDRHATPDWRTDGVAVRDSGADSVCRRLTVEGPLADHARQVAYEGDIYRGPSPSAPTLSGWVR